MVKQLDCDNPKSETDNPNVRRQSEMPMCVTNTLYLMRAHITFMFWKFIRCFGFRRSMFPSYSLFLSFPFSFPFSFSFSLFDMRFGRVIEKFRPPFWLLPIWNVGAQVKCKYSGDSSGKFMWIDNEYTRKCEFGWFLFALRLLGIVLVRSFALFRLYVLRFISSFGMLVFLSLVFLYLSIVYMWLYRLLATFFHSTQRLK